MSRTDGQLLTGAQALVESLERAGVEVAFGIPGGAILPAYDPLFDSRIRHILVRHEQGGGHAAEGYAIASGRVGVCIATSGPGATNLVTAIGNAYMDSTPLVAITGQVNGTAIGTRFDDRVTGRLDSFAPNAKVIHADIDPAEIGKNRAVDVPIVGDCRQTLALLVKEIDRAPDTEEWIQGLGKMKERYQPRWDEAPDGKLSPQEVIQRIGRLSPEDAIYVTGVGQHQMWSAHFLPHERPMKWLTSGGAGTMGFCIPAAMGAKVAQPDKVVWGIDGDGCFQMTNQELVTCVLNQIPIKIAVINNHALGMVRQWQSLFYDSRYSNTDLHSEHLPNFPMLAEAMGCVGLRATNEAEMDECIAKALEINDRPVVVEFVVHKDAMVWPMVAAGVSNDEIQVARNMAPVWEEEEL